MSEQENLQNVEANTLKSLCSKIEDMKNSSSPFSSSLISLLNDFKSMIDKSWSEVFDLEIYNNMDDFIITKGNDDKTTFKALENLKQRVVFAKQDAKRKLKAEKDNSFPFANSYLMIYEDFQRIIDDEMRELATKAIKLGTCAHDSGGTVDILKISEYKVPELRNGAVYGNMSGTSWPTIIYSNSKELWNFVNLETGYYSPKPFDADTWATHCKAGRVIALAPTISAYYRENFMVKDGHRAMNTIPIGQKVLVQTKKGWVQARAALCEASDAQSQACSTPRNDVWVTPHAYLPYWWLLPQWA
jgi:hypothetical protein